MRGEVYRCATRLDTFRREAPWWGSGALEPKELRCWRCSWRQPVGDFAEIYRRRDENADPYELPTRDGSTCVQLRAASCTP